VPVQPVDKPIICNPYEEPNDHWIYDKETGAASRAGRRRPAGYWYKTDRTGGRQLDLFAEEERDDLPLVNMLRAEVRRWRESGYRGATNVTRDLLNHWRRKDLPRRLFFCQVEAAETLIYLSELRIPGKSSRTGFRNFELSEDNLRKLLRGEKPRLPIEYESQAADYWPALVDRPADDAFLPLTRLGCKMATGSGKTVVMAMLVAWAFCNRGTNPGSREFPRGVLVCCPNLTVRERLQVLRPDVPGNFYEFFDLVPVKYRPLLQAGRILILNWHQFLPESEHREGEQSYAVVNKGPETAQVFAQRVLRDLYEDLPILVLNDEGHHCWRPAPEPEGLTGEERKDLESEKEEATVWIEGLDRINNAGRDGQSRGISVCVDLSATPF
jgi:type III restriction enzyme